MCLFVFLAPMQILAVSDETPIGEGSIIEPENDALPYYVDNQVIVVLKESYLSARAIYPNDAELDLGVRAIRMELLNPSTAAGGREAEDATEGNNAFLITLADSGEQAVLDAIQILNADPRVEYAQPNFLYYMCATVPDDLYYEDQWHLEVIQAPEAWDITTGSNDVVVGIIDTGIDGAHPDLFDNLWVNLGEILGDGFDNDGNGYIDDFYGYDFVNEMGGIPTDYVGHGTHVVGLVGAIGNNGTDVCGVCWNVKLAWLAVINTNEWPIKLDTNGACDAINTHLKLKHRQYPFSTRDAPNGIFAEGANGLA